MSGFIFLRPWLLALAILALIALIWRLAKDQRVGNWTQSVDPHLMQAMSEMGRISGRGWHGLARNPMLWALSLMLLSLGGPAMSVREANAYRNLDGVMLVLDISPSVTEAGHLRPLVTMARSLLQSVGSRPAGLIVYSGDSYLASELTTDTRQIEFTLELLDEKTIPDKGSRPKLALNQALDVLGKNKTLRSDIVWLTDGGSWSDIDPLDLQSELEHSNTRFTVITSGQRENGSLQAFTRVLDAAIYDATQISEASAYLSDVSGQTLAQSDLRLLSYRELGPLLLLPSALMLLLWFRRPA